MKQFSLGLLSIIALATASPASTAVTISTGSSNTTLNIGQSATFNFNGFTGSPSGVISGLTSALTLTLFSQTATSTVFDFVIANTSSSPMLASRISAFGFNVDPNITGAGISGSTFDNVVFGANFPNQIGNVEVCFTTQNCPGGGGGGVLMGQSDDGRLTLNFAGSASNITLSNLAIRYQSLQGAGGAGSATGQVVTAVPESGSWALMLIGFGAVGATMRGRRRYKVGMISQMA